jgi:predicted proteasome-type protease
MDVRINEVQSRVQVGDSQSLLDPRVMRELVRACVKAVKEELERDKRLENERRLRFGCSSGTRCEE